MATARKSTKSTPAVEVEEEEVAAIVAEPTFKQIAKLIEKNL